MKTKKLFISILLGAMIALAGCSEVAPEPVAENKEAEKPAEPVDGRTAFFRIFPAARAWARDAQGLQLENLNIEQVKRDGGKFGAWRASFYSPSKGRVGVFNYSVVEVGGKLQKGIFTDREEGYSGGLAKPWPAVALRISSEKALEVALQRKETKEYVKKNPNKPISFLLEHTNRHQNPAWRIIWGESVSRSDFSVFVDASTGDFIEVMR